MLTVNYSKKPCWYWSWHSSIAFFLRAYIILKESYLDSKLTLRNLRMCTSEFRHPCGTKFRNMLIYKSSDVRILIKNKL